MIFFIIVQIIILIWDTNDSLTVSGTANIVAAGFDNSEAITITNNNNLNTTYS